MKNIVIGSGPAGRLASLELGKLNENVILIEKNHIAGTCLNEGCMVICALTDITKFIDENNRFNNYGFIKSQMDISYEKITKKIIETQEKLRHLNQLENESMGNEIIFGEANIDKENVIVNNETLEYDNLLIATGTRPFIPDIKGGLKYGLTNKDILKIDKIPKKLNIIGGGVISCEIANIYSTLGSEVTVICRSKFLKELSDNARKYILDKIIPEVTIIEDMNVSEVRKNKTILEDRHQLEGNTFFATGRTPNSEIVKDIVELENDNTIKVNEMMQTSIGNIYAAGDVTGGYQLTPVARMEGITAARNMANYPNKISYSCIPQCLSLNTEVSFVENDLKSDDISTIAIPGIAGPNAFWKILTAETGFCEIEFDNKNNRINRINSISPSSHSDVAYISYLMRMDYDLDDYANFLEIHPSTDSNYKIIKNMWL